MGWWRIKDVESGAIDFEAKTAAKTANAIPGKDKSSHAYNGDGPADVMDCALGKINALYQEAWKRDVTLDELRAVFNFCTGGVSGRGEKEPKMDAPKAGDVVRLKSGGPEMTCGKETDEVRRVKCHWFIRASFYEQYSTSGYFPLASLVVVNDEPGQGETETAEAAATRCHEEMEKARSKFVGAVLEAVARGVPPPRSDTLRENIAQAATECHGEMNAASRDFVTALVPQLLHPAPEKGEPESEHQDKFHLGDPALMAGVRVTIARVCGRAGRYDVKVGEGDSYTVWKDICECRLRPAPRPPEESAEG